MEEIEKYNFNLAEILFHQFLSNSDYNNYNDNDFIFRFFNKNRFQGKLYLRFSDLRLFKVLNILF